MTNETRTPSPDDGPTEFDGERYMAERMAEEAAKHPEQQGEFSPLRAFDAPADHDGIMQPVDPADFERIDARELVERLRAWSNDPGDDFTLGDEPPITLMQGAADLIEGLLAERADAVQASEKIGRAKGRRFARKLSQRIAKLGVRTWR